MAVDLDGNAMEVDLDGNASDVGGKDPEDIGGDASDAGGKFPDDNKQVPTSGDAENFLKVLA